jgi:hypothetical protein
MGKMKALSLDFKGYSIQGEAHMTLWGGAQGSINMQEVFIEDGQLSADRLKESVNDNGFGCQSIDYAIVDIYKCYGEYPYYKEYDRTIVLNDKQCKPVRLYK